MDKCNIIKNIPIFQYGKSENPLFVTEEAVKKAIEYFTNKPVMQYNSNDNYNKNNLLIGIISRVNRIEFPYVYGDIMLHSNYNHYTIEKFRNYGIKVINQHEENEIIYVDEFELDDVSFDISDNITKFKMEYDCKWIGDERDG